MRVFLAHAKSMDDASIEEWSKDVAKMFVEAGVPDVEVIPGRDDFAKYAPSAGGFTGWVRDVATRTDAMTGAKYYGAYVSPTSTIGKATADILTLALHHKMPVIWADKLECGSIEMRRVTQVVVDDADDYTSGWWLDT